MYGGKPLSWCKAIKIVIEFFDTKENVHILI